jgi:hypothetical protein
VVTFAKESANLRLIDPVVATNTNSEKGFAVDKLEESRVG